MQTRPRAVMNANLHRKTLAYPAVAASAFMLAALLVLWARPVQAAQSSAQFAVSIHLLANPIPTGGGGLGPSTGFCLSNTGTGTFGATITYVCSTGAIVDISPGRSGSSMHGGAFRYVTTVSMAGETLATVDSYTGVGTITSWRVVNLVDLDYLEMMVHW